MVVFMLCTVNLHTSEKQKAQEHHFLGLVNPLASLGDYAGMIPELAARQAQGIIMGEAPVLRLSCPFQFGTTFSSPCHNLD
jgi:hypothetical protein